MPGVIAIASLEGKPEEKTIVELIMGDMISMVTSLNWALYKPDSTDHLLIIITALMAQTLDKSYGTYDSASLPSKILRLLLELLFLPLSVS